MKVRRPSDEDLQLWSQVTATIRPLEGKTRPRPQPVFTKIRPIAADQFHQAPEPAFKPREIGTSLDGNWDRRLSRGAVSVDMAIDLHGETLASAHRKLEAGLRQAISVQARLVLLITGRSASDNPRMPPTGRGVIRASVRDWLATSPLAGHIAAIRPAGPRHGGAGALYIVLRRERARSITRR